METTLPPGPRFPGFLTLYLTARHTEGVLEYCRKRFPDYFTLRLLGGKTIVFASAPAGVEAILTATSDTLMGDQSIAVLVGEHSVLALNGPAHTAARDLLAPMFQPETFNSYRGALQQVCAEELATWPVNQRFALLPRLEALTLGVAVSAIFGKRNGDGIDEMLARFRQVLAFRDRPITTLMMNLQNRRPPQQLQRLLAAFHAEQDKQIELARQDSQLDRRENVLARLVRATHPDGSPLSNAEIRDHLMTLLVQGHTSAAVTMAWMMERLVRHPQHLERVQAEAQTDSEEYLEAVLTEVLRLRHSAVAIIVRGVRSPLQLGQYVIEPGYLVAANVYALHRNPDLYPQPFQFQPERWLNNKPGRLTWIPFGGGERGCIGRSFAMYQMKYVLREMLRQFRFAPTDAPDEKSRRRGIAWLPREGAQVTIAQRISTAAEPQQPPEVARPAAS